MMITTTTTTTTTTTATISTACESFLTHCESSDKKNEVNGETAIRVQ